MNLTAQRIIATFIIVCGLLVGLGYAIALLLVSDRAEAGEQWGALTGFALFSALVAVFWLMATFRMSGHSDGTTRLPPAWLSLLAFGLLVGAGAGLDALGIATYLAPVLTVFGFAFVGAFFLRLAAHWMPDRRLPLRSVLLPGAFGVFLSPIILMVIQGVALVVILAAVFTGIFAANPDFEIDPNLEERISEFAEEQGTSATGAELPDIVEAPTIALALFSVVAIIAPFIEELVKAAGAIAILARRETVTRADALFAAVASSLGFALFEGVGYTLGAGAAWYQLMLVRAPVVVMHLAATTIIVIGWYRMRETGRGFIPYFVTGTLLHAGWNALYVGFIYSLTGIESGADPSAGQAVGVLAMVLLLGLLFVAGFLWFIFASRKAGLSERNSTLADESIDRAQPLQAAIVGSR